MKLQEQKEIKAENLVDDFVKEWRVENNTEDAVYSAYHYDAMIAFAEYFKEISNQNNLEELKNNKIIFDAYEKYKTSNPDFLANDEMFENKDRPTTTYRFFTQEEFINKVKTNDRFAKKWVLTFKSE